MIDLKPPFRIATSADAKQLADLVNFAGEGMPLHLWEGLAEDGEDPWSVGRARQAGKADEGKIVVIDEGQGAIAELTGYPIGPTPEDIGPDFPPLLRPLQELENKALMSWYVNVLASYPEHRGKGYGTRLLALAEDLARASDRSRMSLIVADTNTGARRLYERKGYIEAARAPCVRDGWTTDTENWVLMTKAL